jgi:DNA-binding transcriptional regulator YiaG
MTKKLKMENYQRNNANFNTDIPPNRNIYLFSEQPVQTKPMQSNPPPKQPIKNIQTLHISSNLANKTYASQYNTHVNNSRKWERKNTLFSQTSLTTTEQKPNQIK